MIEINPIGPVKYSVIWLHGLGADGNDFVPVVEAMQLADAIPLRFIFPHAEEQAVTINGGMMMRSWYDITHPDLTEQPDLAGIELSVRRINNMIEKEIARGIAEENIILAGFSQGGLIALATGLKRKLKGIIALSTYLPETLYPVSASVPVFVGYGLYDNVVSPEQGEMLVNRLETIGCMVDSNTYPMEHSVSSDEILHIKMWLLNLLES